MAFANVILERFKVAILKPEKIYVDKVGIGKGLYDRLREFKELKDVVVGVAAGVSAENSDIFFNKRAEMYWRLKEWLAYAELEGEEWDDLSDIRYKVQSDRKLKLKSKQEMLKDNVQSPDVADSLSLTFYDKETFQFTYTEKPRIADSRYEGTVSLHPDPDEITEQELAKW
jgi:hypothetical protein